MQKIALVGNIGVGKSLLLEKLSSDYVTFQEPLSDWQSFNNEYNVLELMYSEPKRWFYLFQSCVQLTLTRLVLQNTTAHDTQITLFERSLDCARSVFTKHAVLHGILSPVEFSLLEAWYDLLSNQFNLSPDYSIYLRLPAETCLDRVRERARVEEQKISLSYLKEIELLYDEAYLNRPNVFLIDANQTPDQVLTQVRSILSELEKH